MPLKTLLGLGRAANEPEDIAGEIQLEIEDYAELERDFGRDYAAEIQLQLADRLRGELSRFDTLHINQRGRFRLAVRDSEAVDLHKISQRLVDLIEGEPVCHRRSLVECRARAIIVSGEVPTLTCAGEQSA